MLFKVPLFCTLLLSCLSWAAPIPENSHSGDMTFFAPGLGACGKFSKDTDLMVAVSAEFYNSFGSMSNGNPVCGRQILITHEDKSVTVTVEDKCPSCSPDDLDLSPAAFQKLADLSVGRLHNVHWELL